MSKKSWEPDKENWKRFWDSLNDRSILIVVSDPETNEARVGPLANLPSLINFANGINDPVILTGPPSPAEELHETYLCITGRDDKTVVGPIGQMADILKATQDFKTPVAFLGHPIPLCDLQELFNDLASIGAAAVAMDALKRLAASGEEKKEDAYEEDETMPLDWDAILQAFADAEAPGTAE